MVYRCRVKHLVVESLSIKGKCAMYGSSINANIQTKVGLSKGEYAIDIPMLVKGVNSGDVIDVTDYNGTLKDAWLQIPCL